MKDPTARALALAGCLIAIWFCAGPFPQHQAETQTELRHEWRHCADVVLVGVSRTSKTPLSMYLGYLGWRVANVPIVNGIDPPQELFEIDPVRVVGLTIDAERLAEIRAERIQLMGGDRSYASLRAVYDELEYAAGIHRRLGCPVIDVSELSIEEIAQRILRTVERRTAVRGGAVR